MNRLLTSVLLATALGLTGCGKELTAGGQREGEVNAVATDADESPGAAAARYASLGSARRTSAAAQTLADGVIRMDVAVALVARSGARVPITATPVPVEVAIGSPARVAFARDSVAVGDYPAVQLTFTSVRAEVQGLLLAGASFSGTVTVDVGANLVVSAPVTVPVRERTPATLVLDLNSDAWLALAQIQPTLPPAATVTGEAFRSAISVSVETGG